jgi:hypothetical protein
MMICVKGLSSSGEGRCDRSRLREREVAVVHPERLRSIAGGLSGSGFGLCAARAKRHC